VSIHLIQCAAQLRLKPGEKLVLLCLAENANARDARAFPGLEALMVWSGLSRARVFEILKTLAELRFIEQVKPGHRGQAAEFTVFPYGCCTVHCAGLYGSAGPDASGTEEGSAPSNPYDPGKGPASRTAAASCGQSDASDPDAEKGSGDESERVQSHAQVKGPAHRTPLKNHPQKTTPRLSGTSSTSTETVALHGDSDADLLARATA
jgi:hypothetical protein